MIKIRAARNGRTEEPAIDAVAALLGRNDVAVWFDVDSPTAPELAFLERHLRIHSLTLEDIVKQNQRPKIESFDEYLYLTIHPLVPKGRLFVERREVDLLLGHNWLATVRYGEIPALLEGSAPHSRLEPALLRGADFLLYTVVDLIVDGFFPLMDDIEEEIDSLQDRLMRRVEAEDANRLILLRRTLVHVRRSLGPQREIFNQLTRRDSRFIRPESVVYFRDVYDHLIRLIEELDSVRELLSGALEIHVTSSSNQLNETIKRLSAWGTILIVITVIASIYGMNFEHMPELGWRYGYPAILATMAAVAAGLYVYFKRKGYL